MVKYVIFTGAGASYGSGEVFPYNPPLGNQLFRNLKRNYPNTWGSLPIEIEEKFTENFELGMEEVWKSDFSVNIPPLMKTMGEYFSKFQPGSNNLYIKLISHIQANDILDTTLFSTLNYECLLELAGSRLEIPINYFYNVTQDNLNIYKLHGSCNFWPVNFSTNQGLSFGKGSGISLGPGGSVTFSKNGVRINSGVSVKSGVRAIQPNEVSHYIRTDRNLYPPMSLYMKGKPTQMAPQIIQNLQSKWMQQLNIANKIILIGIRPYSVDSHIWKPLEEATSQLIYCGTSDAFTEWEGYSNLQEDPIIVNGYFQDAFEEILSHLV